jgi:hypothetical protein
MVIVSMKYNKLNVPQTSIILSHAGVTMKEFVLVTRSVDHFYTQPVSTSYYSTTADFYNPQITVRG